MNDAIYQRIAREIRESIESGELQPGDRVPSTREITVRWNVAMATATKVLVTLRSEGFVRPVAGVGTVVSPEGGEAARPRAQETDLTGERLVLAAVRLADSEGLDAVSMRRVASPSSLSRLAWRAPWALTSCCFRPVRWRMVSTIAATMARLTHGDTSLAPKKPWRKPSIM